MGGILSDLLLDEAGNLGQIPSKEGKQRPTIHDGVVIPEWPREQRSCRRSTRKSTPARSILPPCTRGHHRLCKPRPTMVEAMPRSRRLTFGERMEMVYDLDPRLVERSSTPTESSLPERMMQEIVFQNDNTEYGAWTAYLRTPGSFHGQIKPDLPGAFSGMCFPRSDPRWINCLDHQNLSTASTAVMTSAVVH